MNSSEVETEPEIKTPNKELPQKNPYEVEVPNIQPFVPLFSIMPKFSLNL
jgi:hypothetical protein